MTFIVVLALHFDPYLVGKKPYLQVKSISNLYYSLMTASRTLIMVPYSQRVYRQLESGGCFVLGVL